MGGRALAVRIRRHQGKDLMRAEVRAKRDAFLHKLKSRPAVMDQPAQNHLRRTALLRRARRADLLPRPSLQPLHRDQCRPLGDHVSATTTATASISATIATKASASGSDISHIRRLLHAHLANQRVTRASLDEPSDP